MKILILDVETNKQMEWGATPAFHDRYPFIIDIAWILASQDGEVYTERSHLIKPDGWTIPSEGFWVEHGYDTITSMRDGEDMWPVLAAFERDLNLSDVQVAHNCAFDKRIIQANYHRFVQGGLLKFSNEFCIMQKTRQIVKALDKNNRVKAPRLEELYQFCFNKPLIGGHRAKTDAEATKDCFFHLLHTKRISL